MKRNKQTSRDGRKGVGSYCAKGKRRYNYDGMYRTLITRHKNGVERSPLAAHLIRRGIMGEV